MVSKRFGDASELYSSMRIDITIADARPTFRIIEKPQQLLDFPSSRVKLQILYIDRTIEIHGIHGDHALPGSSGHLFLRPFRFYPQMR